MNELPDLQHGGQEPPHTMDAVQPHGRMVVLAPDGRLMAWTDNWTGPEEASVAVRKFAPDLYSLPVGEPPAPMGRTHLDGRWFDVLAHRNGDTAILEFEANAPETGTQAPIYSLARSFLPQLERADSVEALATLAADEVKRLTGFGRVLVCRFDADGDGEVLSECLDPGYESFVHHRFPAAEVPAQARELFRHNHIRLIPDADGEPVPLRAVDAHWSPCTLDLSFASLRSVPPVQRESLRAMGVRASLSVSIVVCGRLWGLVACHHSQPRYPGVETRTACEHLGQLLALQIAAKEKSEGIEEQLELRKLTLQIVSHLADGDDATLRRLFDEPAPLLRLARASGAAVVLNDRCWTVGKTPTDAQIVSLAQWIATRGDSTYASDALAQEFEPAATWESAIAGVLALSISQVNRHLVIWFRPEKVVRIQWAGLPREQPDGADRPLPPRKSPQGWTEVVRGRSAPWSAVEAEAAAELRHALIGIVLRRAEEMAEVAAELGRANTELEAFSYTVSHDLRAPMRHIAGYLDLVQELDGAQLSERSRRYLTNVRQAAAYAGQLVDALLDFSRMGRCELKRSWVSLDLLVPELAAEFARHEGDARIVWEIEPGLPRVRADPFLIQVVTRNLLSNAVKYSRPRETPRIRITPATRDQGVGLQVSDNGVGFQQQYVGKLFGVFQRLHKAEDFEGTGIGLASVRRIVERHGGSVWAEGVVGHGASFGFVLPREPDGSLPPSSDKPLH